MRKIAVIDKTGKLLDTTTVYPTEPQNDVEGAKKVLNAAIHTYIAAFLTSLVYFLRFLSLLMILNNRD